MRASCFNLPAPFGPAPRVPDGAQWFSLHEPSECSCHLLLPASDERGEGEWPGQTGFFSMNRSNARLFSLSLRGTSGERGCLAGLTGPTAEASAEKEDQREKTPVPNRFMVPEAAHELSEAPLGFRGGFMVPNRRERRRCKVCSRRWGRWWGRWEEIRSAAGFH